MIQYGDRVDDHENIRGRGRGRGQNPWPTQQKSERTALKFSTAVLVPKCTCTATHKHTGENRIHNSQARISTAVLVSVYPSYVLLFAASGSLILIGPKVFPKTTVKNWKMR